MSQLFVTYRSEHVEPEPSPTMSLPAMTSTEFDRLFDPSAILRHGRWRDVSENSAEGSDISGMEQEVVERRWAIASARRRTQVRRYPPRLMWTELTITAGEDDLADLLGTLPI
jgi:hypothetical protein